MKIIRKSGDTSNILQIFIQDSSSAVGAGLTGLANNTSGLTAYYHKDTDTTATAITLATMTVGTFTSSGFKEIDSTNMPGWYQFCPPDAALSTSGTPKSVGFHLKGATNMAPLAIEVQLVTFDVQLAALTAAAIATGVWQDATAGDFTTASSIGKSLYTSGAVPGAASGLALVGSNMGTITGALTGAQIATAVWTDTVAGDFTVAISIGKSIMNGVALGTGLTANALTTNNDKTGYSLSQAFPANFASLGISAGGHVSNVDTLTTYTGNTPQTGDNFPRIGAPTGASIAADVAAVKSDSGAIKTQTDKLAFTVANKVDANTLAMNGDATAAANVSKSMHAIARGTCSGGTTTTAVVSAMTSPASLGAAGQLIGRTILFDADTATTNLQGQASNITGNTTGATPTITFTAMTTAPANGDTFSVV